MAEPQDISDSIEVFDVDDAQRLPIMDIVNSSLDSLTVGFDDMSPDDLQTFLSEGGYGGRGPQTFDLSPSPAQASSRPGSRGRMTNLTEKVLKDILAAGQRRFANARRRFNPADPHEFRLIPITGANPLGIFHKGIQFPLPPEKFDVQREQAPRTFVAINGVEYSLPGPQTLASITLEGMLPNTNPARWKDTGGRPNYLPGYVTGGTYRKPKDLGNTFERIMRQGQPMQLTIGPHNGGNAYKTNGGLIGVIYVTIVSFQYGEAFGHPGDYVFSMGLKEWRPIIPNPKVRKYLSDVSKANSILRPKPKPDTNTTVSGGVGNSFSGSGPGVGSPPPNTPAPLPAPPLTNRSPVTRPNVTSYVVRQGDTLFDIAANVLGTGTRWPEIYTLNKTVIEKECKLRRASSYPKGWHIFPGTRLVMPQKGQRDAS